MQTTTTNSYQIQDDGATSQELDIHKTNNSSTNTDGDDKTYLVEEIYPPLLLNL